jgi:hypothetical protein
VMDMVVEQIAEIGDDPAFARVVIVRPKDSYEIGVSCKRLPNSSERVIVHLDVCIDEDNDVSARPA